MRPLQNGLHCVFQYFVEHFSRYIDLDLVIRSGSDRLMYSFYLQKSKLENAVQELQEKCKDEKSTVSKAS